MNVRETVDQHPEVDGLTGNVANLTAATGLRLGGDGLDKATRL